ncbi:signal recognition particle-docking protein FtsY [Algivirga pacifica]|uniref:Signal recognition particle receptor FtsY n=1 Tax=Algivirga pacifica TaxID=1162670 RepID=A0ABP9DJP1_9BACT
MGLLDRLKNKFSGEPLSTEDKDNLDKGLEKSRGSFFTQLTKAVAGKSKVDDEVLDNLEEILVTADVGVDTTLKIIERIEERVERDKYLDAEELNTILHEEIAGLLSENQTEDVHGFSVPEDKKPYVILVVGVNGVGKTTTIGKLAAKYIAQGKKVVLGAGDTFRAAAVDQLKMWGERVGADVISRGMNTDPSAVAFDAVQRGVETNADVVIVDTAGRLHNKINLMNELTKIRRVMTKVTDGVPHEVLLVLDGSTGQNAVIQAREFTKATEVTAIAVTKLDGTAKGGVVIGISDEFKIPVKYIGVGEGVDHLQAFNKMEFVASFFNAPKA